MGCMRLCVCSLEVLSLVYYSLYFVAKFLLVLHDGTGGVHITTVTMTSHIQRPLQKPALKYITTAPWLGLQYNIYCNMTFLTYEPLCSHVLQQQRQG
jgi:hypothetical protein